MIRRLITNVGDLRVRRVNFTISLPLRCRSSSKIYYYGIRILFALIIFVVFLAFTLPSIPSFIDHEFYPDVGSVSFRFVFYIAILILI